MENILSGLSETFSQKIKFYKLGNIRDILGTAMKNKNEFRKRQSAINSYMVKYKVPKVVQERVKLWMEFSWEQQKNCDENKMLAFLPGKMRTDLALRVRL